MRREVSLGFVEERARGRGARWGFFKLNGQSYKVGLIRKQLVEMAHAINIMPNMGHALGS